MNYTTAVFLINAKVRAVSVTYEAQLAHVGCDCAQAHAGETPHFEMPF